MGLSRSRMPLLVGRKATALPMSDDMISRTGSADLVGRGPLPAGGRTFGICMRIANRMDFLQNKKCKTN